MVVVIYMYLTICLFQSLASLRETYANIHQILHYTTVILQAQLITATLLSVNPQRQNINFVKNGDQMDV